MAHPRQATCARRRLTGLMCLLPHVGHQHQTLPASLRGLAGILSPLGCLERSPPKSLDPRCWLKCSAGRQPFSTERGVGPLCYVLLVHARPLQHCPPVAALHIHRVSPRLRGQNTAHQIQVALVDSLPEVIGYIPLPRGDFSEFVDAVPKERQKSLSTTRREESHTCVLPAYAPVRPAGASSACGTGDALARGTGRVDECGLVGIGARERAYVLYAHFCQVPPRTYAHVKQHVLLAAETRRSTSVSRKTHRQQELPLK